MSKFIPGIVQTEDLIRHAAMTEKFVAAEFRKTRRANWGWRLYAAMMTVMVFMLSGALNYALPLVRLVPVFFYQKPDGALETALTTESLPADLSDANIQAWLWQYIHARESYSWAETPYNHYVVNAMSTVPVRTAYDTWEDGKNPNSYQAAYGSHGVIRVQRCDVVSFERAHDGQPGQYIVHFARVVEVDDHRQAPETWTATLHYLQDYTGGGLKISDVLSFNPSRIVITSYPGAHSLTDTPMPKNTDRVCQS